MYRKIGREAMGISGLLYCFYMEKKSILFAILVTVSCFAFVSYYSAAALNSLFRNASPLNSAQVVATLQNISQNCTSLENCDLQPGDMLLRRYITSQTALYNVLIHPYFTHSAMYIGNDRIVEAVGIERKQGTNEVQISKLSKSDWMHSGIQSFVVIRPKYPPGALSEIRDSIAHIAEDDNVRFGFSPVHNKSTTCSALIYSELRLGHVIDATSTPPLITPDQLYWLAYSNPDTFTTVAKYAVPSPTPLYQQ